MSPQLQTILDSIQNTADLSESEKESLIRKVKEADKAQSLSQFKLDRLEKDRNTLTIMLQESIEDLQKKSRAIEAQNRELEIESSLEKVRTVAMGMRKRDDMLDICRIISGQLELLGIKEIRNVQTAIFYKDKGTYINYEYYRLHDKALVTEVDYTNDEMSIEFAARMIKGADEVFVRGLEGQQVKDWLNVQKTTNVFIDTNLENAGSLTYYWFSLGPVAIGMSAYDPLSEEETALFKRFRNVFDLAYRRYLDIEKAEAQARQAQMEAALERVRARTMAMQKPSEFVDVINVIGEQFINLGFDFDWVNFSANGLDVSKAIDIWNFVAVPGLYQGATRLVIPFFEHPVFTKAVESVNQYYTSGNDFSVVLLDKNDKDSFLDHLFTNTLYKDLPDEVKTSQYNRDVYLTSNVVLKDTWLSLGKYDAKLLTNEQIAILKRLANAFGQAYSRFLDLQKAEAQAREAQIELGLERVRARAMAMQKSDELAELVDTVFKELTKLHFTLDRCLIIIVDERSMSANYWMANPESKTPTSYHLEFKDIPFLTATFNAWKGRKTKMVYDLKGDEKSSTVEYIFSKTELRFLPDEVKEGMKSTNRIFLNSSFNNFGGLQADTIEPLSEDNLEILHRFAKVFDLTYTRFNDLQKAEAQAREAEIELALERVRARTMAMQKSDELAELMFTIFNSITSLGIPENQVEVCYIITFDPVKPVGEIYLTKDGSFMPDSYSIRFDEDPLFKSIYEHWKKGESFYVGHLEGQRLYDHFEYMRTHTSLPALQTREEITAQLNETFSHVLYFSQGYLAIVTRQPVESFHPIFKRFGNVLQQTYTRFLDLQTAEAQARESQIQLALERVRARTMAMQHSDELKDAAALLFQQVKSLGAPAYSCGYNIWEKDEKTFTSWMSTQDGSIINGVPNIPLTEDANFIRYVESKQNGEPFFVLELRSERMQEHYQYLKTIPAFKAYFDYAVSVGFDLPKTQIHHMANFSQGNLLFITLEPCPEFHDVFKRFAAVFEQTYTRFLDLQKAEAQAREAQIEAALERVRARAMAMHRSEELNEVANEMRKQLGLLGQNELETCAIHLYDESPDYFQSWAALLSPNVQGEVIQTQSQFPKRGVKIIEEMLECYAQHKQDYVLINEGAKAQQFLEMIKQKAPEVFEVVEKSMKEQTPEDKRAYWSVADFAGGSLVMTTMIEPGENSRALLRRFANVFGLAYRRFTDLKKAEAQAREAQIETALERVRSRTLAMQKSDELAEAAAVLFKQLILLGINPNRLYINIIKDEKAAAEFWITDEDGSKISMEYEANMNVNASMKKMYEGWRKQNKSMVIDMHGEELEEYFKHLSSLKVPFRGGLSQKRRLQYIAYFSKGFIGMASPDEQPAETMQLLERFAAVFNLTFTRFNDLKIAEAHALQAEQDLIEIKGARKKAEDALTELQATQKQLVQSEKMASLGELTAGIAHEIQNPLNFVNNFSDVSNELLEEMKSELEKGNTKDVIAIVDDVKQNLEKILHHGKRADAIVKGMLQHSRTSSSQKELTDINALADEYLRLAYHGLRAKDKSFNAKFITDFDNNVGKINIIPQEIGRVILNLINNAFYAVSEKQKAPQSALGGGVMYEPTVSVSTKQMVDKVLIAVTDNGGGIPQKNLDKIFQPFFTTKPTGQGTGLGLSLAYDIITKGHNGEMKVETQEGEGSKFIVIIPSTQ